MVPLNREVAGFAVGSGGTLEHNSHVSFIPSPISLLFHLFQGTFESKVSRICVYLLKDFGYQGCMDDYLGDAPILMEVSAQQRV